MRDALHQNNDVRQARRRGCRCAGSNVGKGGDHSQNHGGGKSEAEGHSTKVSKRIESPRIFPIFKNTKPDVFEHIETVARKKMRGK